ncbi:MAG: hypothetical protein IT205_03075 [Fimbriimonadaceae bacterium]|nr:hypothetical protein [Fimbriimonadaceae bacterium]
MIVQFTPDELIDVIRFADAQHSNKLRVGARELKHNAKLMPFEIHYIGALGEFAVAKVFGVEPDRRILDGSDGGVDLVLHGRTCSVKTFTYTGKNPEVYVDHYPKADILIACRLMSPCQVEISGYITRENFKEKATRKSYGYGERLTVLCSLLSPIRLPTQSAASRITTW